MTKSRLMRRLDSSGISIVEVMVAIVILTIMAGGLVSFSLVADRQLRMGRQDDRMYAAVQEQMEAIAAAGYDSLSADSSQVLGFKMRWEVQGSDPAPKRVLLMVETENWGRAAVTDTFVTSLAKDGGS